MTRARLLLAAAAADIIAGGALIAATWGLSFGYGLYCAVGVATTVGCDATPHGTAGRIVVVAVMLTAIPLLAAAFAQLHLDKVRDHIDKAHAAIHKRLDGIEKNGTVAEAQVKGGAGSNPAEAGLTAEIASGDSPEDERLIPPPATTITPRTGGEKTMTGAA
jgi:hypothetical protein